MTGNAWKRRPILLLTAAAITAIGCVPSPAPSPPAPPPLPPTKEILAGLSRAILQPGTTCTELRDDLGLTGLPIVDTPAGLGLPYEEHLVLVASAVQLRVWYIPGQGLGTVVVSPGNTGPMTCYLLTAGLLSEGGASVVLYDYEGFGGSVGQPALEVLRSDLEAVVEWTRARTGASQVTLFGMSLGSIPSVAVAVERPEAVNGVVLDSPVALGWEIERFAFLVRGRAPEIVAALAAAEPWLLSEDIIGEMRQPLLVFLHGRDSVTPARLVNLLYERAGGPKELVTFPELEHASGQFLDTANYAAHLNAFVNALSER